MELSFRTKELRTICEHPDRAEGAIGQVAHLLRARLADLRAASSIGDLPLDIEVARYAGKAAMRVALDERFALYLAPHDESVANMQAAHRLVVLAVEKEG